MLFKSGDLGGSRMTWMPSRTRIPRNAADYFQLVCGYVWVNDHGATRLDLRAPLGGMKASGIRREQGIEGSRAFQDTRSIAHLDAAALAAMTH
jgi:acyl-CoA reductase-like NAD-dependent aldehyde dehydrogenase